MTSEGECVQITLFLWHVYTIMCDRFFKFLFSFAESSISCISREFVLADEPAAVVVRIEKAVINQTGVEFEYRDDPEFTTVTPKTVIPG